MLTDAETQAFEDPPSPRLMCGRLVNHNETKYYAKKFGWNDFRMFCKTSFVTCYFNAINFVEFEKPNFLD